MTRKRILDKIKDLDNAISAFDASLGFHDGSALTLTREQETKIRDWLAEYRQLLLESDISL